MSAALRVGMLVSSIALSGACGTLRSAAGGKNARAGSCSVDATLVSARPATLEIEMRCSGRELSGFTSADPTAAVHIRQVRTAAGAALAAEGYRWRLPGQTTDARIRYRVDLERIAREIDHFDVAQRIGSSLVAPASTWLLRPEPLDAGIPVTLRVRTPPGVSFATGLRRVSDDTYAIEAHEIRTATYAVFGEFARSDIDLAGRSGRTATLEVAILDAPLDSPRPELERWISASAQAVSEFWGGFPVRRALLMVVPVRGRQGVLFGKVLPESAPGIALLVGQHTEPGALYDDWVLVHELFHLGFPSFDGEGKWLDEGLATYYEPLIRARHGWRTEQQVWAEFVRAMPQGIRAATYGGLEKASSYREVYWGGALVALLADVEARRRSRGAVGLEHGLRAVIEAGGTASEVWTLERVVTVVDSRYPAPLLGPLTRAHAHAGTPVDLARLWRQLGVEQTPDGIALRDDAPLADVRKSVVFGASRAPRRVP